MLELKNVFIKSDNLDIKNPWSKEKSQQQTPSTYGLNLGSADQCSQDSAISA